MIWQRCLNSLKRPWNITRASATWSTLLSIYFLLLFVLKQYFSEWHLSVWRTCITCMTKPSVISAKARWRRVETSKMSSTRPKTPRTLFSSWRPWCTVTRKTRTRLEPFCIKHITIGKPFYL